MSDNIFLKIIRKEIPADIVYEDADILAFRDIYPLAPVHILIVPKKPIESMVALEEQDAGLVGRMFWAAKRIAEDLNISEKGYKLLIRTGQDGGQEVPHLHLHLLGGAKLTEGIRPVNN